MVKINYVLVLVALLAGCSYNNLEDQFVDCEMLNLRIESAISDSDCAIDNGSISLSVEGGAEPYIYKVNTIVQNNGFFSGLGPGNYLIVVTDKNGCFTEVETLVANKTGFVATSEAVPSGCGTSEGSLTLTPASGAQPYMYQLDGSSAQESNKFAGLASGKHQVLVTDADDCTFEINAFVPSGVSYSVSISPIVTKSCAVTGCHNGTNSLPDFRSLSNFQAFAGQVKFRTQSKNMPATGSITQEEIDLIACWVDDGALDN